MEDKMRVLVALTASPYDPSDLERAAQLAAALEADLHGMFLEDLELLALAALPGAMEISYPPAVERKIELAALEQTYRREAEKARARLIECGAKVHVRCDFEVIRERRLPGAISRAGAADLVFVLGGSRRQAVSQRAPIAAGPVVAVCDDSPAGRRALQAAGRLGRKLNIPVIAALVDGMSPVERARTVEALQMESPGVTFAPVRVSDWLDWAALARGRRASLLMVGLGRAQPSPGEVERLVRQAGCPAVLVG